MQGLKSSDEDALHIGIEIYWYICTINYSLRCFYVCFPDALDLDLGLMRKTFEIIMDLKPKV